MFSSAKPHHVGLGTCARLTSCRKFTSHFILHLISLSPLSHFNFSSNDISSKSTIAPDRSRLGPSILNPRVSTRFANSSSSPPHPQYTLGNPSIFLKSPLEK